MMSQLPSRLLGLDGMEYEASEGMRRPRLLSALHGLLRGHIQ